MWGLLAVVIAGVAGTLANSAVQHVAGGRPFGETARNWGRYGVAVACAVYLPVSYESFPPVAATIVALVALTITPALLAKLVFDNPAPWGTILALNTVYAGVTWCVWLLLS